jgi:hypothetical protein
MIFKIRINARPVSGFTNLLCYVIYSDAWGQYFKAEKGSKSYVKLSFKEKIFILWKTEFSVKQNIKAACAKCVF